MSECPVCGGEVEISADPVEGELLECAECGVDSKSWRWIP